MKTVSISLPKLGESILSAQILRWFKKIGERVVCDEPLLEVATDKVNSEIPSPATGILHEILAMPNEEKEVGSVIAVIAIEEGACEQKSASEEGPRKQTCVVACPSAIKPMLTPAVLRLAQEKGLSLQGVEKMLGTGDGGRVTKQDIESYAQRLASTVVSLSQGDDCLERIPMSFLRKAIAENMVRSYTQVPHASLITEIDLTNLVKAIEARKFLFLQKTGVKLTVTAVLARAIAQTVQNYPLLNATLEKEEIVVKRFVNLGIAVSVEEGVLVPVIRNCHELDLESIAKQVAELSVRARTSCLSVDQMREGSITLTNFGMTGVQIGIPIIRYPEAAILGFGGIRKEVKVMQDDSLAIRSIANLSLTLDHRIVDGLYGCSFLNALKSVLEEPEALF